MSAADLPDENILTIVRAILIDELNLWADRCGYTRSVTRESTSTDSLTLTALMVPRTDGEWPLIHQAIAEDSRQAERRLRPTDPRQPVLGPETAILAALGPFEATVPADSPVVTRRSGRLGNRYCSTMSSDGALEPSPFDEDDGYRAPGPATVGSRRFPLTQEELDRYTAAARSRRGRTTRGTACGTHNAEDGIGYYSGVGKRQCETVLADPTKSRYCLEHATAMGVDYYAPGELSEAADKEAATNLTRLVPKAIRTIWRTVMDDEDAPPGIRAKAASDVLDRTGYAKGVDVRVDARVATVDITSMLSDRLNALRDAQLARARPRAARLLPKLAETPAETAVVPGEVDRYA